MTQINKNDVNQIFASNAPDQDKPPSFANYTTGWGTSRSNNGKPTIKGFNFLQQRTDQNFLWIHQNGGALPYDDSIDYVDGSIVLKDGYLQKTINGVWSKVVPDQQDLSYFISTVESYQDLINLNDVWDGRTVKIRGYYKPTNFALAQPYKGGATYIYSTATNSWNIQITDGYVDVFMFGAKADYSEKTMNGTDDQPAIMKAIDAALANDVYVVHIPQGNYYTKDTIDCAGSTPATTIPSIFDRGVNGQLLKGVLLNGDGRLATNIYFEPQSVDHAGLRVQRSTGVASRMGIDGISITPASWTGATMNSDDNYQKQLNGIGIEIADQCFSTIRDVFVGAFNDGIRLSNNWGFCEFNRFDNIHIDFATNCIHYYHNGGYESYHGNSWELTMIQVRKGGIGIKVSRSGTVGVDGQTQPYIYHNLFNINAYGESNAYIYRSYNGTVATGHGTITVEGRNAWKIDNTVDFCEIFGSLNVLHHGDAIFECGDRSTLAGTSYQYDSEESFRFGNSSNEINFSGNYSGLVPVLSSGNTFKPMYQPRVFNQDPEIITTSTGGLGFVIRGTDVAGWTFLAGGNSNGRTQHGYVKHAVPIWNLSGNSGDIKSYSSNFVFGAKTATKELNIQLSHDLNALMPQQNNTISLGVGALAYASVWTTAWEIGNAGILPRKTATYNIGSNSSTVNNIYTQNAVTVVSDRNAKNSIQAIDDKVLDAWSEVKPKQYKLNGDDNWSFGYIAQDIVDAFTRHGLDYKQYNIVHEEDGKFMLKYDMCAVLESALNRRKQK
ncbi:MAG: hypothetical protein [Caudoviricetes sp.]|nr:MAG: hypothetical protein [Caudoviricetes sp.]